MGKRRPVMLGIEQNGLCILLWWYRGLVNAVVIHMGSPLRKYGTCSIVVVLL